MKWYDQPWMDDERLQAFIDTVTKPNGLSGQYILMMVEEAKRELERRKIARTKLGKVLK